MNRGRGVFNFKDNKWEIWAKPGCPYCEKAKKTISSLNEPYIVYDSDQARKDIEKRFENDKDPYKRNFKTWPKIFLNGNFIGGYSDLENKLKSP